MTHQDKLSAFMAEHKADMPQSVIEYARRLYKVNPMNPGEGKPPLIWFDHFIDAVIADWKKEHVKVKPSHLRLVKPKAA